MKLSTELQTVVERALRDADERQHEFSTVEHLLFAMLTSDAASAVLRGAGADVVELKADVESYLKDSVEPLPEGVTVPVRPSLGFSRVVQRAALHVQSSGRDEVKPANVLVAIFAEQDSHARYLLEEAGCTRLSLVRFISHGGADASRPAYEGDGPATAGDDAGEGETAEDPLSAYTTDLNARAEAGDIDEIRL